MIYSHVFLSDISARRIQSFGVVDDDKDVVHRSEPRIFGDFIDEHHPDRVNKNDLRFEFSGPPGNNISWLLLECSSWVT